MRKKSLTGPLMLLMVGGLFLWNNMHPEAPIFDMVARYWPFLLIGWGFLRLVEVVIWRDRSHYSFSGGEVVLVVLICIAGSAVWQANQHGIHINGRGLDVFG